MSDPSSTRLRPIPVIALLIGVLALVIVVFVLASDGGGSEDVTTPTSTSVDSETPKDPQGAEVPQRLDAPADTPDMPVAVTVSNTESLASGTAVAIRAEPEQQSELYGVEARLCRGDVAVLDDGMFTPTLGGVCTPTALAPETDARLSKIGAPPYQGIDLDFRVGVGSHTFLTQFNGDATVTCGAANPCQIVLKLQYPNGFGFRGIPVTFS